MVKVLIAVPYRGHDARRDYLWKFVKTKYVSQYGKGMTGWDYWSSPGPLEGPFNRGAAINETANKFDWETLVVHDADTICDPFTLRAAVWRVQNHLDIEVVFPYETYIYLDHISSDKITKYDNMRFISPEVHPTQGVRTTVRHKHVSGAMVISRKAWDAVGGFIELEGWGAEDEIMYWLFKTFATEPVWMRGGAYHLWHPATRNDNSVTDITNHNILADIMALAPVPDQLRDYLREGGHPIP